MFPIPCHCLNSRGSADLRHNELMIHEVMFSRANSKRCGRHWTLVAGLADDISHVCSFASQDSSLPHKTEEFNHACSLFVTQAGDLGCFKSAAPTCAKPYISSTWYQKHLSKCSLTLSPLGRSLAEPEPFVVNGRLYYVYLFANKWSLSTFICLPLTLTRVGLQDINAVQFRVFIVSITS